MHAALSPPAKQSSTENAQNHKQELQTYARMTRSPLLDCHLEVAIEKFRSEGDWTLITAISVQCSTSWAIWPSRVRSLCEFMISHRRWKWIYYVFLKFMNNSWDKTREITTMKEVWVWNPNYIKFGVLLLWICLRIINALKSYIKHSKEWKYMENFCIIII